MPIWPKNTREWNRENDDWKKVTNVKNVGPGNLRYSKNISLKRYKKNS